VTNVVLKDWDRAGRYWMLDTASGAALATGAGLSHGFLCAFPERDGVAMVPRVVAVYAESGKLWFQVDGSRWLVEDVEIDHELDVTGTSQFTLSLRGESVVDLVYLGPAADSVNRLDPSLDALDMEMQDIFYFMARNGRNPAWRAGVLQGWGAGIT
jgi:hypothetical protein